jgi:uncharacterized membrane protein
MLSRLIVASYTLLLEIALWLALALAAITGYQVTVPMMESAGALLTNEFAWKMCGTLVFPIITFLVLALITGPLFVLVDIRRAVRNIEGRAREEVTRSLPFERKEPSF